MRVRIYQATDGDCLLVESTGAAGSAMLVDGGRKTSWREHTAVDLAGRDLDLVVVSHIDNDHISGIVELFDQTVAWLVYRKQQEILDADAPGLDEQELARRRRELDRLRPDAPEPPSVGEVWHNAFADQVNFGGGSVPLTQSEIDARLVSAMRMLLLDPRFEEDFEDTANIAQGVKEAILLRDRLSPAQLDLPVNRPAEGDTLLYLPDATGSGSVRAVPIAVGGFEILVLGPSRDDLVRLEREWEKWLADNAAIAEQLREEARRESERIDAGETPVFRSVLANLAQRIGDSSRVTPPNLASLLLLVRAGGRTLLLSGDGSASEVLRGLRAHRLLAPEPVPGGGDGEGGGRPPATIHVDLLKVPHHGALDNIDVEGFFTTVTADHYLFCGNGAHHNPEVEVVEMVLDARARDQAPRDYHLWFSSSSRAANTEPRRRQMRELEELVAGRERCTAPVLGAEGAGGGADPAEGVSYATIEIE